MNIVNLSTAVHRLAKLTANDIGAQAELRKHPAVEELLRATSAAFNCLDTSEAQPQSLSNVAWSLATMRLMHRPLIQVVAELAVANVSSFKPFELSTMLWAFAKLGTIEPTSWCAKPAFQAAATHIMKQVEHFGFRCLATTAWAFATARQRHARLFRAIASQMVPMVHAANCQEMANTAWAFGTADFHDNQLFTELAEKALLRLDNFKPQELSNMLWGFATNGFFHEGFFASASLAAQRMDLQAQHLANILWAFARVRPRHPVTQATTLALLPMCIMQLETFKPQEVSSTALAVSKAFGAADDNERGGSPMSFQRGGYPVLPLQVQEFFDAVTTWAMLRLHDFSAQSLANTVSAYAMVQVIGAEALFAAIAQEVSKRFNSLEPTALLHLLKGFSAAPPESVVGVVRMLAEGVAQRIHELRPQEIQTLSRICSTALGIRQSRDFTPEELRSQCYSLAAGEGIAGLPPPIPELERRAGSSRGVLAPPTGPLRDTAHWPEPVPSLPLPEDIYDVHHATLSSMLDLPGGPVVPPECLPTAAPLGLLGGGCAASSALAHHALAGSLGCPAELPFGRHVVPPYPLGPPVPPVPPLRTKGGMLPLPAHVPPHAQIPPPGVLPHPGGPTLAQVVHGPPRLPLDCLPTVPVPPRGIPPTMGMPVAWPDERMLPTMGMPVAWPDEDLAAQALHTMLPTALGDMPPVFDPSLCPSVAEPFPTVPPPLTTIPKMRGASAMPNPVPRGLPLSTVEEMSVATEITYNMEYAEAAAQYMAALPNMRRPSGQRWANQVPYAPGGQKTRVPPGQQGHPDLGWRCSVKNSFLHVECHPNSDDDQDSHDGGSSQRSSSVPSRFDHEEYWEDRTRRLPDMTQKEWTRRHPSLDNLDFDWGASQQRRQQAAGSSDDHIDWSRHRTLPLDATLVQQFAPGFGEQQLPVPSVPLCSTMPARMLPLDATLVHQLAPEFSEQQLPLPSVPLCSTMPVRSLEACMLQPQTVPSVTVCAALEDLSHLMPDSAAAFVPSIADAYDLTCAAASSLRGRPS